MRGVRGLGGRYGAAVAVLAGATIGLVVVLLVGGGSSDPGGSAGSPTATESSRPTDPAPGPVPSVLPAAGTPVGEPPTTAGLTAALAAPLRAPVLGPRIGMVVLDGSSGATLFGRSATSSMAPASTAKLVTAASALRFVGADARIDTRTVAGSSPAQVVLVGGGDPTITRNGRGAYPGSASLDSLAKQTAAAVPVANRGAVRLVLDDTLFTGPRTGPGWDPTDLTSGMVARVSALMVDEGRVTPGQLARHADPTAAAGRAFAAALKKYGVTVAGTTRGAAPADARELGSVSSPPVSGLVERMLLDSDNDLAESLAHLAGVAAGTGGSFTGASEASRQTLSWLGVDATGVVVVDGSGISRSNRVTAAALGELLVASSAADRPELAAVLTGLPVAGVNGSLADRFDGVRTDDARGRVRAKTGTLTGVNGLAGTVRDAQGRTLAFVVIADRTSADTLAARAALDRVAATLEACGCR